MKVLINRYWNRIEICCNEKAIIVKNIMYPIYSDYHIEHLSSFKEDCENSKVVEEEKCWLFNGVDGEYIYLDVYKSTGNKNIVELWVQMAKIMMDYLAMLNSKTISGTF